MDDGPCRVSQAACVTAWLAAWVRLDSACNCTAQQASKEGRRAEAREALRARTKEQKVVRVGAESIDQTGLSAG